MPIGFLIVSRESSLVIKDCVFWGYIVCCFSSDLFESVGCEAMLTVDSFILSLSIIWMRFTTVSSFLVTFLVSYSSSFSAMILCSATAISSCCKFWLIGLLNELLIIWFSNVPLLLEVSRISFYLLALDSISSFKTDLFEFLNELIPTHLISCKLLFRYTGSFAEKSPLGSSLLMLFWIDEFLMNLGSASICMAEIEPWLPIEVNWSLF